MENFDKGKYLKAVAKKEQLEEQLNTVNQFIQEQHTILDNQFNDELEADSIEISDTLERVKKISKSVDSTLVYEKLSEEVGEEIYKKAEEDATTTRTSINRTKLINFIKKEKPEVKERIKEIEEECTTLSLKYETIDVSK